MDSSSFSFSSYYYSTSILSQLSHLDRPFPFPPSPTTRIPIDSTADPPVPIPVQNPPAERVAATKIQAAYRSRLTRTLLRRIATVDAEAARYEAEIRTQETVDAVRRNERERLRLSEDLMALLLQLDSVPGFYPAVRNIRRQVSRRIVALQEILDAVAVAGESILGLDGFPTAWEDVLFGVPLARDGSSLDGAEEETRKQQWELDPAGDFFWPSGLGTLEDKSSK